MSGEAAVELCALFTGGRPRSHDSVPPVQVALVGQGTRGSENFGINAEASHREETALALSLAAWVALPGS